ncbi:kinase-like protein [Dacryopinax primogenitus]|uniref:Kinase-like protein n=1 Tax=Dacryopinax primogenitus (strain DJM 731) TaxID=1858805 RepID=M5FWZ7_DACPD|nr:kinase-like protein [Dacryopinax primogenitus]EJT97986.1 kinase-like protein [Dacryopinax primogenitus]
MTTPWKKGERRWIGEVQDQWVMYSDNPTDYTLHAPIGYGSTSVVYLSSYHPPSSSSPSQPLACAVKLINLDLLPPQSLHQLTQETRLMSLSKHPNVLRVRGSWTEGSRLYIAMRLMRKGSVADLMAYRYQGGLAEDVCRCILKQALEGLKYLHVNGFIHRDVKAANLLIDDDGTVLLGDLGVAVSTLDDVPSPTSTTFSSSTFSTSIGTSTGTGAGTGTGTGNGTATARPRIRKRSFVGTPSWMAPEVIRRQAYDSSADIWSFGILSLELTRGRAPYSRLPPSRILSQILTLPPPTLLLTGGVYTYTPQFADIISLCLSPDPGARPGAGELLDKAWFRQARKKAFLVGSVLQGLPPLEERLVRRGEGDGGGRARGRGGILRSLGWGRGRGRGRGRGVWGA